VLVAGQYCSVSFILKRTQRFIADSGSKLADLLSDISGGTHHGSKHYHRRATIENYIECYIKFEILANKPRFDEYFFR